MESIKEFPRGIAGVTAITKCSIGHPDGLSFGSTAPAIWSNYAGTLISAYVTNERVELDFWTRQLAELKRRLKWSVRPGPGYKLQAPSFKRQATSFRRQASSVRRSGKQQALNVIPIVKRQARRFAMIGYKTVDRGALIKFY